MRKILDLLPELQGEEMTHIQSVIKDMSDENAEQFAHLYRARRRDPQNVMIASILSLFVVPGLQRFYLKQIGMGVLYFFTLGLCFVGSVLDLINYQKLTQEYNSQIVQEILLLMRGELKASND